MRTDITSATSAIFAANRARGSVKFDVHQLGGITRRRDLHESGSLRVRFPSPEAEGLSAVFVNTAGGVAGGDRFEIEIAAGAGSRIVVTTAAAEKVYRAEGPSAQLEISLQAAAGSHLAWLPQETILFDRARLSRSIEADLAPDAQLFLAESIVFGRSGMGETVQEGALFDRWRVRRDGKLIYAEGVRLDGPIAQRLAASAVAKGGIAIATVLIVPGDNETVQAVRALQDKFTGEVGASTWNGIAAVRLCAAEGAALRRDLVHVMTAVRGDLPRLWTN